MKGFQNIGNTCYLNAGLQMLIQNKDLCKMILKYSDHSETLQKIGEFIQEYYSSNNESLSPATIKSIVEINKEIIFGFQQQDTTEFIVHLMDIIDTEIKKINKDDGLQNIFGITINTRTKCKLRECLNISNMKEKHNFLMLDLNLETTSLEEAYRNLKSGEKLEADNKYYCENCKAKRIASKRYSIETWPSHLFIWLKRFKQDGRRVSKMSQMIKIPLEWRHNMKLQGAVIHYGGLNGGHYVYAGNVKDKWFLFNDSNVSEIPSGELESLLSQAYWLYYGTS